MSALPASAHLFPCAVYMESRLELEPPDGRDIDLSTKQHGPRILDAGDRAWLHQALVGNQDHLGPTLFAGWTHDTAGARSDLVSPWE